VIALQGYRVAVVDTDLQSPGIHILFQMGNTTTKTLNDYLWGRSPIHEVAYDVTPDGCRGRLSLVPACVNAEEIARILSEGYNVSLLNEGFRQLIKALQLDYLLIDTHPGLSRETLLSIAIANLLILILRPDQQDYQGTAVTIDVAHQLKVRKLMLVVNKVLRKTDFPTLQSTIETTYKTNVSGMFPLFEEIIELGSRGLFCLQNSDHPFTQILNQVAAQITL
jgi:MinD-like ATPase involved in chromosome partitioning or flagellar assembly